MKIYNKLVRDRIPEIIEASGKKAGIRIADNTEYRDLLRSKLAEEVKEYLEEDSPEELVDIVEVIRYLCVAHGISFDELLRSADKKKAEKGGFDRKIVLIDVINE